MFKIGEIAIYVYKGLLDDNPDCAKFDGCEVEILSNEYFFSKEYPSVYKIHWPDGDRDACTTDALRKKRPPTDAKEWFDKKIKVKELVKR